MSAQQQPTKPGWRRRIAQWLDPVTPQLKSAAESWSAVRDPQPGAQSTPPGGIVRVNVIRLKGYVRNQIEEMRMQMVPVHPPKYLLPPPKPRQDSDAMCALPPASPHADVLYTLPPMWHNPAAHMAPETRAEVFSQLGTVPKRSEQPSEPIRPVGLIDRVQLERTALRENEDEMPDWAQKPDKEDEWLNSHDEQVQVWAEPNRAEMFADVRQPSGSLEDDEPTVEHPRTKRDRMFKEAITGLLGNGEIA